MADVDDVAAYILAHKSPLTTWQLQKLVYYSQAWHVAWEGTPLFNVAVEAWANGPVVPALYHRHKGKFTVRTWTWGDPDGLALNEAETVDAVLSFYGDKPPHWLRQLTHEEKPWLDARAGVAPEDRGNREITTDAMGEYYGEL